MTQRPSLDEYFLEIASVVGKRATCRRHRVGSVIVLDKRIIATGYNGAPSGMDHCLDVGCIRDERGIPSGTQAQICKSVHSEQNAIIQAAVHGVSIAGGTLYCTHQPCILCTKMLINSGIKRVVFGEAYPDEDAIELFNECGIEYELLEVK